MQNSKKNVGTRLKKALQARLRETSPRMRVINIVSAVVALVLSVICMFILGSMLQTYEATEATNKAYDRCERAVELMQEASDYLTGQVRLFVSTGDRAYMDAYLAELQYRQRREKAVLSLREQAGDSEAVTSLEEAEKHSDELAETELYAMKLIVEATDIQSSSNIIQKTHLSAEHSALSNEEKRKLANDLVYGEDYLNKKLLISTKVHECSNELTSSLRSEIGESEQKLSVLLSAMRISVIALLLVVLFIIASTVYLLLWPMSMHAKKLVEDEPLVPSGARELRVLTDAYNEMYEEKHWRAMQLKQEAETDGLTCLLNRGAFETLIGSCMKNIALILVDVDNFKVFNDDFGHDMGDAVLIEVAATLLDTFRSTDYVCRIGGDEFAIIMADTYPTMRGAIVEKLDKVTSFLRDTSNGLPSVTVSVGVVFETDLEPGQEIFKTADKALYVTKRNGRDGITFASDVA